MRLTHIKLAGFKSFLEPTTIPFQTDLTAIVGPNGCGKSNIIDAIRWVVGESSAKQLRGESMADVIFNGTTDRKPVGKASVELLFDNASGRMGDKFANYNEVSVKRQVTRDGQSSYYLNNTLCRRRDIMDILLGTGLGPRSYAIIEQGMISNLIAAKPEDLRFYLEEAAGTTKYKERRREAENRMRHTRENLDRLNDLREELEKQLKHLKRQANAAKQYKQLKASLRLIEAQIETMQWMSLCQQASALHTKIQADEVQLESILATQTHQDTEAEHLIQKQTLQADTLNKAQATFYEVSAKITRLEQSIKDAAQQEKRFKEGLSQLTQNQAHLLLQIQQDQAQLEQMRKSFEQLKPQLESAKTQSLVLEKALEVQEEAMQAWQSQWDQFNEAASKNNETFQVKQTQIQHLERELKNVESRMSRLNEERVKLENEEEDDRRKELESESIKIKLQLEEKKERIEQLEQESIEQKRRLKSEEESLNGLKRDLHGLQAEKKSLDTLQTLALSHRDKAFENWLETQGIKDFSCLAQNLEVEAGWEKALEVVLGEFLDAVCVDDIQRLAGQVSGEQTGLRLFESIDSAVRGGASTQRLLDKVSASCPVESLIGHVFAVDSLEEAFSLRDTLAPYESIVTKQGVWLGRAWLKTADIKDERAGIMVRKQRIEQLKKEIERIQEEIRLCEGKVAVASEHLSDLEKQIKLAQEEQSQLRDEYSKAKAAIQAKQAYFDRMADRKSQIHRELEELKAQAREDSAALAEAKERLAELSRSLTENKEGREKLQMQKMSLQKALSEAQTQVREQERCVAELKAKINSEQQRENYLINDIKRTQSQLEELNKQIESTQHHLTEVNEPLPKWKSELEKYLEEKWLNEQHLDASRTALQETEATLNNLKTQTAEKAKEIEALRSQLGQLRLEHQSFEVRAENHADQVKRLGLDLKTTMEELPENADKNEWMENKQKIAAKIQKLGEINLAAIEEYDQLLERSKHLEAQHDDLVEALGILEEAIAKIDRETRERLKETFERVNNDFMTLFPKIFGGGRACLEVTENNFLSTGIIVKAQPPGKRNATIHLLSGGEKALTAIALVFSFFRLNPAPFCVLDEVDAPLDDQNVGRFCRLVEEMSESVQFIYISHNKVAISMAKQLTGITMQEAGVSRVVSVNVDQAIKMAEE